MPWSFHTSPLDRTLTSLEWLVRHMERELAGGEEIAREDYRAVMLGIARVVEDLKPLQDLPVRERRVEQPE